MRTPPYYRLLCRIVIKIVVIGNMRLQPLFKVAMIFKVECHGRVFRMPGNIKLTSPAPHHHIHAALVALGNYLQVGQPIMQIVPDEVWVVANFKEIQLTHMKEHQPVSIKVDTYPHKRFKGEVQSIQRATGAKSSLFPPENAVGSYVKIVQRVPVKIVFKEDISNYNIVPGMSVVPKVKVK